MNDLISQKLTFADNSLQDLQAFEFRCSDNQLELSHVQTALERKLYLLIDSAIQINAYTLFTYEGHQPISRYHTFFKLAEHNILDPEIAAQLAPTVCVRDRIRYSPTALTLSLMGFTAQEILKTYPIYLSQLRHHYQLPKPTQTNSNS